MGRPAASAVRSGFNGLVRSLTLREYSAADPARRRPAVVSLLPAVVAPARRRELDPPDRAVGIERTIDANEGGDGIARHPIAKIRRLLARDRCGHAERAGQPGLRDVPRRGP